MIDPISSGFIPYMIEMLFEEEPCTVDKFYKSLNKTERQFIFDRPNVPLKKTIGLESQLIDKIKKIRNDKRRKAKNT